MDKDHSQEYWNWVGNIIALPVATAGAIWLCLSLAKNDSFSLSFGSGDLISISAMMFIVLYQEITITPVDKRTPFSKVLHGLAFAIIAVLWALYGFAKYYAQINIESKESLVLENLFNISLGSAILLLFMGVMCMIQKYKIK